MGLKDIGNSLPPGFRFYPSDEELVCHYLVKRIGNEEVHRGTLVEIDLHTCEPWQLPDVAKLNSNEWYFFSFRDRKYATGFRSNRATNSGYWKATGKDRTIHDPRSGALVGMRKTLVFYKNRAPNGIKTGWIMHEFRVENPNVPPKEDWVLCRVFHKSRSGENSNKITSINEMDNIYDCTTSPNLATSLTIEQSFMPPRTSHGSSSLDPGYGLHLSYVDHEPNNLSIFSYNQNRMVDHINCDDEYGFLLDMKFDDSTAAPSAIGDIKFGDGDGSVFM